MNRDRQTPTPTRILCRLKSPDFGIGRRMIGLEWGVRTKFDSYGLESAPFECIWFSLWDKCENFYLKSFINTILSTLLLGLHHSTLNLRVSLHNPRKQKTLKDGNYTQSRGTNGKHLVLKCVKRIYYFPHETETPSRSLLQNKL